MPISPAWYEAVDRRKFSSRRGPIDCRSLVTRAQPLQLSPQKNHLNTGVTIDGPSFDGGLCQLGCRLRDADRVAPKQRNWQREVQADDLVVAFDADLATAAQTHRKVRVKLLALQIKLTGRSWSLITDGGKLKSIPRCLR